MTISMLVSTASSILSPLSSHCELIPSTEKLGARFKDVFANFYAFKIVLSPKLLH
jgi:hypothetical protein